ncbi:hypothetical protein REH81_10840, partial [Vibrio rotiferianus]
MNMKDIGRFFSQRWLISLIGVFAFSIFIWFVGPLISISSYEPLKTDFQRLITILTVVLVWAL